MPLIKRFWNKGLKGPPSRWRRVRLSAFGLLAVVWVAVGNGHSRKPLPEGVSLKGPERSAQGMEFLFDLTSGSPEAGSIEHQIFDRVFSMITEADEFVVLDMFLFNGSTGGEVAYRGLSGELTDSLVAWKGRGEKRRAIFITDEINSFYGAAASPEVERLKEAGVEVVITRLTRLRDSNPGFSGFWRMALQWFGTAGPGWLPNFLSSSGEKVPARAYLKLLNFKANHRKLIVTDNECLVASANPHDGSARHSNIAFAGSGPICGDLLEGEKAVAAFSGGEVADWPVFQARSLRHEAVSAEISPDAESGSDASGVQGPPTETGTVRLVTEGKILEAILTSLEGAGHGHTVDLAMFYLSHRSVVKALLDASARGAEVRLILDPNKDAFGKQKGGIPNRQVAHELVEGSGGEIQVRWYDTNGEQFHTKLARISGSDTTVIIGGSANLTRRNIGDFNLEANLHFVLAATSNLAASTGDYFERIFQNRDRAFTRPYQAYAHAGLFKRIRYRIEEFTGFCSY